jgi:hypothetical protein
MENKHPKGYDNPKAWEKFEDKPKTIIIDKDSVQNEIVDIDDIIYTEEIQNDDFNEVLQLTEYNDTSTNIATRDSFVIAEYKDINVEIVQKSHELEAKKFVSKITKFVLEFNDLALTEEHKSYLQDIGNLQLQHLSDIMYLVDINRQMLNNIISRVNATQAEDYSIINTYNNLVNQHLRLIKELQTTYKSIPSVMKKMRAEVMCNQELQEKNSDNDEMITSEYGNTHFNNSKQMLRTLLDKNKESQ